VPRDYLRGLAEIVKEQDRELRSGRMRAKIVSVAIGLVVMALLFPTGGMSQCEVTTGGGECLSWSDSVLVRYSGENGAVGMAIALVAGIVTAGIVFWLLRVLAHRQTSRLD
jgi:tetrahydromethanopterin S-methyltransferase subunit F